MNILPQTEIEKATIGSPSRDRFKHWHKNELSSRMWGCDLDFCLIDKKNGVIGIAAVLDFKLHNSDKGVSFTEAGAYSYFLDLGIRCFIVWGMKTENGLPPFWVQEIVAADGIPNPPVVKMADDTIKLATAQEFEDWESNIRRQWCLT